MFDDIKKTHWARADKLRANMNGTDYKHLVPGLITVNHISDTFAARRAKLTACLSNPANPSDCGDAAPENIKVELENREDYTEVNALCLPEVDQLRLPEVGAVLEKACA
ncbi:Type I restriction-modification system, DNA-methyltransferase subunit M [Polaromonas sp. CG9_12]|uniref:type I restriction-modification system subunit M n=1 Tax=Polaromonas sp. TaxID=1869339 RepID=UPI0004DDD49D|nr:type I restriction-modification system subunit M [Polaromonas sp.]NDP63113.1 SAM-dependent DNA methyltransferase [Polaromonas sp.]CDS48306.1 Type I restriction-modification system, DNA-methyltransferase subunit M [Polaromonas sp. CG9_12]